MRWKILEDILRAYQKQSRQNLLDERKISDLKNKQDTLLLANYFSEVYSQLPPQIRDRLDKRTRINRWADPQVGQAYTISSGDPPVPGFERNTWNFHWAGVVMKSDDSRDNVTLENYSVNIPDAQNKRWIFQMYGSAQSAEENPAKRGQTFHEEHRSMRTHGQNPTTMVAESVH
jgi:hypothetical protein